MYILYKDWRIVKHSIKRDVMLMIRCILLRHEKVEVRSFFFFPPSPKSFVRGVLKTRHGGRKGRRWSGGRRGKRAGRKNSTRRQRPDN